MILTKKEILELGKKVMEDINFHYDIEDNVTVVFTEESNTVVIPEKSWQVSFHYGEEDYGRNVSAHLLILDEEKRAIDISFRNGYIKLGYDSENDKYFVKEERP